jgi:hypothetical protein
MVQFDPDVWKTFLYERLTTNLGGAGYLSLYGRDSRVHEMIAAHYAAAYAEPVILRGAMFDKWQDRHDRPENQLLDALVGCAVAASMQGSALPEHAPTARKPRKKIDIEELYARANK